MPDRYATRTVVAGAETALIRSTDDGKTWADIATFKRQVDAERAADLFTAAAEPQEATAR